MVKYCKINRYILDIMHRLICMVDIHFFFAYSEFYVLMSVYIFLEWWLRFLEVALCIGLIHDKGSKSLSSSFMTIIWSFTMLLNSCWWIVSTSKWEFRTIVLNIDSDKRYITRYIIFSVGLPKRVRYWLIFPLSDMENTHLIQIWYPIFRTSI